MECAKHELTGCTICSGKFTTRPKAKKPPGKLKQKAAKSADLILAEQVAAGIICGYCSTKIALGCACSRRELYAEDVPDAQSWLLANEEHFIVGNRDAARCIEGARKAITGMAFSTQTRAGRRAGLMESEGQTDRLAILKRFDVDPTWHAPRTQEADYSPI